MTDRRPHWDEDLEQTVTAILFDCYERGISEEQVYQVIAAVEDWTQEKRYPRLLKWWSEQHEAIQRVRELHSPTTGFNGYLWCSAHCESIADGDPTDYPCATIRALDGDA